LFPLGYISLSSSQKFVQNKNWEGISQQLALSLSSYFHQWAPADLELAVNENRLFTSAENDTPTGIFFFFFWKK
jgi:hypothetical protein